ncbi:hypothetical protein [Streptomyces sp. cmx-4-9]|uniref:hypothetical protein n=1 Tax=Streptomyces sp. cmx-4-9 TaxID=2790941 RepID=UPI003980D4CC
MRAAVLGQALLSRTGAQGLGGLGEPALQLGHGASHSRAQGGEPLFGGCRLPFGLLCAKPECGGARRRPAGFLPFPLHLLGRLRPLAQRGPEGGQYGGEFAEGLSYAVQGGPVHGQPQIGRGLVEAGGRQLGPLGRGQHLGGPLLTTEPGPAAVLGGGRGTGVGAGQPGLVRQGAEFGSERTAAGSQRLQLGRGGRRLRPEDLQLGAQVVGTGTARASRAPSPMYSAACLAQRPVRAPTR